MLDFLHSDCAKVISECKHSDMLRCGVVCVIIATPFTSINNLPSS